MELPLVTDRLWLNPMLLLPSHLVVSSEEKQLTTNTSIVLSPRSHEHGNRKTGSGRVRSLDMQHLGAGDQSQGGTVGNKGHEVADAVLELLRLKNKMDAGI